MSFKVSPEVGRNVLFIELAGTVQGAALTDAEPIVRAAISRLRPQFDVVADVRALRGLEPDAFAVCVHLVDVMREHHPGRAVHIVGKSADAALAMERLARATRHSAHLAFSREEADVVLSQR